MGLKEVFEEIARRAKRPHVRAPAELLISTDELEEKRGYKKKWLEQPILSYEFYAFEIPPEGTPQPIEPEEAIARLEHETLYIKERDFEDYIKKQTIRYQSQHIDKLEKKQHPYVFRQTGPGWEIIWKGRPLNPLTGKGFAYLCFLVTHPYETFNILELVKKVDGIDIFGGPIKIGESTDPDKTKEVISQLDSKILFLEHEIDRAKSHGLDLSPLGEKKHELKMLKEYKAELLFNKKFPDDMARARDRIYKALDAALKKLEKVDREAYRHFKYACAPLKTFKHSYRPSEEIPWKFE